MKFHIYCKMTPPITVSRKIDAVLFTKFQNIEIVHWYQHWNLPLIKPFQLEDSDVFKWCIFFLIVNKLKQWNQYTVLTTQIYFLFTLQNTNTIKVLPVIQILIGTNFLPSQFHMEKQLRDKDVVDFTEKINYCIKSHTGTIHCGFLLSV